MSDPPERHIAGTTNETKRERVTVNRRRPGVLYVHKDEMAEFLRNASALHGIEKPPEGEEDNYVKMEVSWGEEA